MSAPAHPGPGLRAPQLRHRLAGEVAGQVARLGRALALATAANSLSSYFENGLDRSEHELIYLLVCGFEIPPPAVDRGQRSGLVHHILHGLRGLGGWRMETSWSGG